MTTKKKHKGSGFIRMAAVLLMSALLAFAMPFSALAGGVDVSADCSFTLSCYYNGNALPDMRFSLYRVGDISESAVFTLSGDFKDYKVSLRDLDNAGWKAAANTLAAYIRPDNIAALKTGVAGRNGVIDFGTLSTGLYLVVGESLAVGDTTYASSPFLVSLPGEGKNGGWSYDVNAAAKLSASVEPPSPPRETTVNISVIKVWNDSGSESKRPENIEAVLLRNGREYRSVTLSASNNWRYTWKGLDDDYDWSVIEETVPEGYVVTYGSRGTVFTIDNSYLEDIPDPGTPTANIPDEDTPTSLPQTGLLWWPVPLMAGAGLLLFALGWRVRFDRRGRGHEK